MWNENAISNEIRENNLSVHKLQETQVTNTLVFYVNGKEVQQIYFCLYKSLICTIIN